MTDNHNKNTKRAVLMIGYLGAGGAERQMTYLATGLADAGWEVSLAAFSLSGEGSHFAPRLRERGIPLYALDSDDKAFRPSGHLLRLARAMPLLHRLPRDIQVEVTKATLLLLRQKPHMVICYLDSVNIVGGLAAVLAGVPRILLSGRNLNPTHFPYLHRPWLRELYQFLLRQRGVTLKANSHAGARSYEQWLGLPHGAVPVVHNGLAEDALPAPAPEAVARVRAGLGIAAEAPLVLGVFRLSPEKRPSLFFELVERLRRDFPGLQAMVAGTSNHFEDYVRELRDSGRADYIHLLGRREDIPALFQAADLMLHVSDAEGVPNAVMEAQWLGCPAAGTLGGGTGEILARAQQPYFHGLDDSEAVLASCRALLADPEHRREVGRQARVEVRAHFSVPALVEHTLAVARKPSPVRLPPALPTAFRPGALMGGMVLWLRMVRPRRRLRALFKKAFTAPLADIHPDSGHCYLAPVETQLPSDDGGRSPLMVCEDGVPLGPGHVSHDVIRTEGGGRFSHWGGWIYFSASDNSDPRSNGRAYSVMEHYDDNHLPFR